MIEITETKHEGFVYDLHVRKNHNFFANNTLVHNCGKKRYILSTLNSEGVAYEVPKISVTGIESVRSTTPRICRGKMNEFFRILMSKDETKAQKFIADFFEEFKQLPLKEVARNSGVDDMGKYADKQTIYKKGCPIHVRGALLYNHYIRQMDLMRKYEPIQGGDKIKFIYLKLPNPIFENVISFMEDIPKEFGLEKYVDYELQYEKVFLGPMTNILDTVNWSAERIATLEDFFG